MGYIQSTNVQVFPSTYRITDPRGKFTSEQNFVNILNSLVDYKTSEPGYVLSWDSGLLKVVIHGYYFEITTAKEQYSNLWASIIVEDKTGCLVSYSDSSINLDVGTEFHGISLDASNPGTSTKAPEGCTLYSLQVLSAGEIVNRARLSSESVRYKETDTSVGNKIDEKQNIITAYSPLTLTADSKLTFDDHTGNHGEYVKYKEQTSKGSEYKHIYTNSNGEIVASSSSVGKKGSTESGVTKSQGVYMVDGSITAGQTFYASTNNPTSSDGEIGDFWFKYSE